jgi:hypothetical protein
MTRDTVVFSHSCLRFEYKYVLTGSIINVIILLKKWVSIKSDGFFGNPSYSQEVSYSFGHQKHDLWVKHQTSDFHLRRDTDHGREDVRQSASKLEHNDNDSDSDAHNAAARTTTLSNQELIREALL